MSSDKDKNILYLFNFNLFWIMFFVLPFIEIKGFPRLSLDISISLNLILLVKPVPIAFTNASFAANLLAKTK